MNPIKERATRLLSKQSLTPYSFHCGGFDIIVRRDVFPPDLSSSSMPLFDAIGKYSSALSLDMGCGTGILSLQLSRISKLVCAVDNHLPAVENTSENVANNGIVNVKIFHGDLFGALPSELKFDLMIFNHPYYPSRENTNFGIDEDGGASLITRFMAESSAHLAPNERILMPFSEFAGRQNDPLPISLDLGFIGSTIWTKLDILGRHWIYEFKSFV